MGAGARTAHIVVDLGYGDAGKGAIVDGLVRRQGAKLIVRYNGGAQAGHNVIAPDGRHHTFSQFGSGTFVPRVRTHLSEYMVVHPLAMLAEEQHLQQLGVRNAFDRLTIDERALCITPFHQAVNRLREIARGDARHGSCGLGVGEAVVESLRWGDALCARDLRDVAVLRRKLQRTRERALAELEGLSLGTGVEIVPRERAVLADAGAVERCVERFDAFARRTHIINPCASAKLIRSARRIVCEGAQGVLLDARYGFHPYTTWSAATSRNAHALLDAARFDGAVQTIGVVRAYATRHGAGPFVSEDADLTRTLRDAHNVWTPWQRELRVGWFDAVATRYALAVDGRVDVLAVTHCDRLRERVRWRACTAYEVAGERVEALEVFDPPDLLRQAARTVRLMATTPVLVETTHARTFDGRFAEHLGFLTRQLRLPVAIAAFGPFASDQQRR